jgi:benzoyl-CoA reductase/2-hydroxyglutaryl-CoA dehydratase subunit BcrC/BadD/HgdB
MNALDKMREAYRDRQLTARAAHPRGDKVVGYFSNNVPEELILAAGLVPVRLTGDPADTTELGDRYMEEFCDAPIRSIFDRVLRGHFNFADLIIVPRTSESYLQLYYYLLEARNWEPGRPFPEIYLFDLLQAPNWTVGRYDRGRLDALRQRLDRLTGTAMADEAIATAIAATNENRRLLTEVNKLRRGDPPRLSGTDMLRIIVTAGFIAKDAHGAALRDILAGVAALEPRPGPRLMVKGTAHDDDRFYELVEACGATIVADDHVAGERGFEHCVAEIGDVMEALTDHYHRHSPSPRSYPQAEQDQRFLALLDEAHVQGVIFYHDEWDDVLGWDYPIQKKLLDDRGIPSIYLKKQPYRTPDRTAQRDAVTSLIRAIP